MAERGGGARSILYICDFNAHGGTQTHLLHLFESLDRRRCAPSLAALTLHPDLAGRLRDLEVEVTDLKLRGAARPATWKAALSLASAARRRRTDLIHGSLFQGNLLAAVVSRLSGVACVTSVRNLDLWKRRRHRLASALAHRRARRVVFNSSAVRDWTAARERIPRTRTVVIHNGVPDLARAGARLGPADAALADPKRPTAVCVASLRPKKGHAHLLEAFRQVRRRIPAARMLLAGEGPLRRSLEAEALATGLDGAVLFIGHRADVQTVLQAADVFVLSSLEEGMPNALLEAMSAGLPAVATDVGGNAEAIEEGRNGFLVPPERPSLMADRLSALLSDPELRRRMGAEARRRYESSFTVERMTAAYHLLYDEVAG